MLGLLPWPQRTPLNVKVTGTLDEGELHHREDRLREHPKILRHRQTCTSRRTAKDPRRRWCTCAARRRPPTAPKAHYQRHGISFAKNGYVAIILDPIQIAETFSRHHGVYSGEMYDWYSRGYTPAGVGDLERHSRHRLSGDAARGGQDAHRHDRTLGRRGHELVHRPRSIPRMKIVAPIMGISTYAADVRENTPGAALRLHVSDQHLACTT